MALTELINTAAAATSDLFAVSVPTSVVASGFASGQSISVLVEVLGGGYEPLVIENKIVKLDALNRVILLIAPGNYKVSKLLTGNVITVAYTS